jgi:hypothetical protein
LSEAKVINIAIRQCCGSPLHINHPGEFIRKSNGGLASARVYARPEVLPNSFGALMEMPIESARLRAALPHARVFIQHRRVYVVAVLLHRPAASFMPAYRKP